MQVEFGAVRAAGSSSSLRALSSTVAGALIVSLAGTGSAFAIPSPELVVGSFTSISQLFALGSALLGGGAAAATLRMRSRGAQARTVFAVALGAFVLLAMSAGLNVYQYMSYSAERQERLEATLTRPMPNFGGRSLDPTLKEVSYGEQLKHPRGISTEDAERLLEETLRGEHPDVTFLDIREKAETEMGSLPNATPIRFPDLATSKLNLANKTAILFCHNGNRSYETCQARWPRRDRLPVHRRRPREVKLGREAIADRSQGPHPGGSARCAELSQSQNVLLDTTEVHKLVDNEDAVFVDTRYPGEFASGALPGAINLPIRPTPTEQLNERIAQLPHKPIIAPCYARRRCFCAEVLGLEATRAGFDYRLGKYTLPWEYFTASKPRPYIEEWLEQARKSWWSKTSDRLADGLIALGGWIGIIPAILLLSILSRLLVAAVLGQGRARPDQVPHRGRRAHRTSRRA